MQDEIEFIIEKSPSNSLKTLVGLTEKESGKFPIRIPSSEIINSIYEEEEQIVGFYKNHVLIGYSRLTHFDGEYGISFSRIGRWYIDVIYILPKYRNTGVGKNFLNWCSSYFEKLSALVYIEDCVSIKLFESVDYVAAKDMPWIELQSLCKEWCYPPLDD